MVVAYLNIKCIAVNKTETDSPLVVNRNRVLAVTVPTQGMKAVSRWRPQIIQPYCQMHILQLAYRTTSHIRQKAASGAFYEQIRCAFVRKVLIIS